MRRKAQSTDTRARWREKGTGNPARTHFGGTDTQKKNTTAIGTPSCSSAKDLLRAPCHLYRAAFWQLCIRSHTQLGKTKTHHLPTPMNSSLSSSPEAHPAKKTHKDKRREKIVCPRCVSITGTQKQKQTRTRARGGFLATPLVLSALDEARRDFVLRHNHGHCTVAGETIAITRR